MKNAIHELLEPLNIEVVCEDKEHPGQNIVRKLEFPKPEPKPGYWERKQQAYDVMSPAEKFRNGMLAILSFILLLCALTFAFFV